MSVGTKRIFHAYTLNPTMPAARLAPPDSPPRRIAPVIKRFASTRAANLTRTS